VLEREKILPEPDQCILNVPIIFIHAHKKCRFKAFVMGVMMPEEFNEIVKVVSIEGPVFEMPEAVQLGRPGMETEIVGTHIHFFHQLFCFVDDGGTVSPCEYGSKKGGDLDVLFLSEKVWDADGVAGNKRLINVYFQFLVKKIFQFLFSAHPANICLWLNLKFNAWKVDLFRRTLGE
jgi:hypothetical protein